MRLRRFVLLAFTLSLLAPGQPAGAPKLGADAHFTYIPDRTHMDLYLVGKDRYGLFDQIATEMYAVARPGVTWKKAN